MEKEELIMMSNYSVRSIILGIGIGIIITAMAGLIYESGKDPLKNVSREQIIMEAEKYGMVKGFSLTNEE